MFGKKVPNKKPQQQIYQEEYSEEQSQPLIEEVDPDYEPTEKEVREYAIQTLGMKLPQDQNLLYLAREGLKAPITTNWVPYQSRDGEIYYKHNITQQKTYDHPTDTEYRKKYEQIKQKAARKNLKSISMKQNLGMQGLLPTSSITSGFGIANNSNMGLSNASGLSAGQDINQPTIDTELLNELEQDYAEYEKKQEKQWREWQAEIQEQHQKKMKRIKQQYEEEKNRLMGKSTSKNDSKILEEQKARTQQNLEDAEESTLNQELRLLEKQQESKLSEYKAVYEEDNSIKLRKLEEDLTQNYEEKSRLLQEKLKKLTERREKQRQNRVRVLKQTKQQLQKPNNPEILNLLHSKLEDNLASIKQEYGRKLKQKQAQLENQLTEMKRLLGVDKSKNLLTLASKKEKLLALSNLKISAKKNKEIQVIETDTQKQLENQKQRLKERLSLECDENLSSKKRQLEDRIQKARMQVQSQFTDKCAKEIEEMYQKTVAQKNNYESSMNKKMSQLRMKYINKISDSSKNKDKEDQIVNRVILQEKQSQIANKSELIKNLEKQLDLEREEWKLTLFDEELCNIMQQGRADSSLVTSFLKQKMRQLNISYQSPELLRYLEMLSSTQAKYGQDKKFLGKILVSIQDTTSYNFAEMRKNNLEGGDSQSMGSGALIKKYNEDVRKMRENQDMLNKFEVLVKKAEHGGSGYEQNLESLRTFVDKEMKYHEITLKNEFKKSNVWNKNDWKQENVGLDKYSNLQKFELPQKQVDGDKQSKSWYSNSGNPNNSMQQALRQHSQFLSNVKNELNRKLYQVRYEFRH